MSEFFEDLVVLRSCIHVISLFLNGAIFCTLCKKSLFRCPSNRFVLSLASSHILVSVLTLLISLSSFIDTSVYTHLEDVNLYVTFGSGLVNSLTLTTISCERYITIARPMRYKSIVTTHRCSLILISLWTLSALVTLVPLIVFTPSMKELDLPYFSIVFTSVTVLSLCTMSGCYYVIFTIAKEKCQHVQIGQFTASISSDWPSSAYPSQAEGQKQSSLLQHVLKANARHVNSFRLQQLERTKQRRPVQNNSPRKTIATIISLLSSLLITQGPVSLTLIQPEFWKVALLVLSISGVTNPILYGFLNRKIRRQLWKTLRISKKPKRPDCCCKAPNSMYSEIIKDLTQAHHHLHHHPHVAVVLPPSGKEEFPTVTIIDNEESKQKQMSERIQEENNDIQILDPTLFPRKDSQDSGADMTFSDEEEEQTKEPNVFTICKKNNSNDDDDDDDDQPHQV